MKPFLEQNFFNGDLSDLKNLTIVTTRPDLSITSYKKLEYFSPFELEHLNTYAYDKFDYDISDLGFRGSDIPKHIQLGAFGCSFTFGQGLSVKHLWHTLVANEYNLQSYNFGQPAIGIETISKIFATIVHHIKLDIAIFLLPPYHRISVPISNDDTFIEIPIIPNYNSRLENMYKLDSNAIYKYLPNEFFIKTFRDHVHIINFIGRTHNTKIFISSWDFDTYQLLLKMNLENLLPIWEGGGILINDFARDNQHPGPLHHFKWANIIKEFIK